MGGLVVSQPAVTDELPVAGVNESGKSTGSAVLTHGRGGGDCLVALRPPAPPIVLLDVRRGGVDHFRHPHPP